MNYSLFADYTNPNYPLSGRELTGTFEAQEFSSGDIPLPAEVLMIVVQTGGDTSRTIDKKTHATRHTRGVGLAMAAPHILTNSAMNHSGKVWSRNTEKLEEVQIGFLRYQKYLLLVMLHKALGQLDRGTDYVLQILKKIGDIEILEGSYEGQFSTFTSMDLGEAGGTMRIDEQTIENFIQGNPIAGTKGPSEVTISKIS